MPTKQRRYPLKTKDAKQIIEEASNRLNLDLDAVLNPKGEIEVVESEIGKIYLVNRKPILFRTNDNEVSPTLVFTEFINKAPKIVVDMGAIPYVCKGAKVMAPGIVRIEGKFGKGDYVLIVDIKHGKALAISESILDSETIKGIKKGPVAKTLHYVSDKIWDYIKALA